MLKTIELIPSKSCENVEEHLERMGGGGGDHKAHPGGQQLRWKFQGCSSHHELQWRGYIGTLISAGRYTGR